MSAYPFLIYLPLSCNAILESRLGINNQFLHKYAVGRKWRAPACCSLGGLDAPVVVSSVGRGRVTGPWWVAGVSVASVVQPEPDPGTTPSRKWAHDSRSPEQC